VIVPSFTFFATAGAVSNAGLRPVFCDVDQGTFCVTRASIEASWTERTVAVIPVHLFGQMADLGDIRELCQERGAFLLEDAAQAFSARAPQGRAGAVGDAGAFSFFPSKNLGGYGDGGLVSTRDASLAERVRSLRLHGGRRMYHHERVGFNSRLDALQAAVLHVKLAHVDSWVDARRANASLYGDHLGGLEEVVLPVEVEGFHHTYNQYTIRAGRRDELREHLLRSEIGCSVYYPVPLHMQECFTDLGYDEGDLPVTEGLCAEVLSLPIFPELGATRLERVAEVIRAFYS
jgi:dTDP-4-amino-4,6-dideoxygalactose transaminase